MGRRKKDISDALALLESGMTQQEAADALGISRNALNKRLSSRGIRLGYNDRSRHRDTAEAAFRASSTTSGTPTDSIT